MTYKEYIEEMEELDNETFIKRMDDAEDGDVDSIIEQYLGKKR